MNNNLDQFYTNPLVSDEFVEETLKFFKNIKINNFLEPSAGSGNFIDSLIKQGISIKKIKAYDIEPKINDEENKKIGIIQQDYLALKLKRNKNRLVIGNPPFGKRSKLAIDFINKSFEHSSYVAMILPNQFNRYLTQKQIVKNAYLVYSRKINKDAFIVNDRRYDVKTVFQIWTTDKRFKDKNIRMLKSLPRKHKDFKTRIHNNTKLTLKYFDKKVFEWDIAVHRQGFYDYNLIITDPKKLIKNRQYFFIKAKNKRILNRIKKIDFEYLSKSNTQTPGFSTTDFVQAYKEKYDTI